MQKELKEKLENLGEKYNKDIDLLSLKALCTVPENEEILEKISQLLEKISKKYPEDEEILKLLPNKEISIEELVNILEKDYSENIDFITLKAMLNLPESSEREKAIKMYLQKINNKDEKDENIKKYLDSKIIKNPLMVFVEGGKWKSKFNYISPEKIMSMKKDIYETEERELSTFDLEVSKYVVTRKEWEKMGFTVRNSYNKNFLNINTPLPLIVEDFHKPVIYVSWWDTLKYCNKLSEEFGLEPVYLIGENGDFEKLKIKYITGETVSPENADFSKTEGYRLPTAVEWEWFARGGEKGLSDGTFNFIYAGSNNKNDVAWSYYRNIEINEVGKKDANSLGLYDCSGNVDEWCFDTHVSSVNSYGVDSIHDYFTFSNNKKFRYKNSEPERVLKGGHLYNPSRGDYSLCNVAECSSSNAEQGYSDVGFRVVRTANPEI